MAIRIRTVNGCRVALCAYETDHADGDVYLDDDDHYSLLAFFSLNYDLDMNFKKEWGVMESQKKRDAKTRKDL